MPKLVLALDQDNLWKIVDLNDDGSYGYTTLTAIPGAGDYGFIIESRPTEAGGISRVLFYDYNQPLQQLQIPATSHSPSYILQYFDLAELIPFPADQVDPTSVRPVGWQIPEHLWAAAVNDWNILISPVWVAVAAPPPPPPPQVLVPGEALLNAYDVLASQADQIRRNDKQLRALRNQMRRQEAQIRWLQAQSEIMRVSPMLSGGSSVTASSASPRASRKLSDVSLMSDFTLGAEFKSPQLPSPPPLIAGLEKAELESVAKAAPKAKVLDPAIQSELARSARDLLKRQQQQHKRTLAIREFESMLGQGNSIENIENLYTFLMENAYVTTLDKNALMEFLNTCKLQQSTCVAMLSGRGSKKVIKAQEKQHKKVNHALLTTLVSYEAHEVGTIPQTFLNISSALDDGTLHKLVVALHKKFGITPPPKPTAAAVAPTAPEPVVAKQKPVAPKTAVLRKLTPVEQLQQLIIERRDQAVINEFLATITSREALETMMLQVLRDSSDHVIHDAVLRRVLALDDEQCLLTIQALMSDGIFKSYISSKERRAIHDDFDRKSNAVMYAKLAALAQMLHNNKSLKKELEKFPFLVNAVDANGKTLLQIAVADANVGAELLEYLIEKADFLHANQQNFDLLTAWVEARANKKLSPKEYEVFKKLYIKSVAATAANYPSSKGVTEARRERFIHESQVAIHAAALLARRTGTTMLQKFIAANSSRPAECAKFLKALTDAVIENPTDAQYIQTSLQIIGKDSNGNNPYMLLENLLLQQPANPAAEGTKAVLDALATVQVHIKDMMRSISGIGLPANYYTADLFDFFNSQSQPTIIVQLLAKLPDEKSAARLKLLVQTRNQLRGSTAWIGRDVAEYVGYNDGQTEILRILKKDMDPDMLKPAAAAKIEAKAFLHKWLEFETQAGNDVGSILYSALHAMQTNANPDDKHEIEVHTLNAEIVKMILDSEPELLRRALSYQAPGSGHTCMWPLLHIVRQQLEEQDDLFSDGEDKIRNIMQIMLQGGLDVLAQNGTGNNILHVILAGYEGDAFTEKTITKLIEYVPDKIPELLKQTNSDGKTPMQAIKSSEKKERVKELFGAFHARPRLTG